ALFLDQRVRGRELSERDVEARFVAALVRLGHSLPALDLALEAEDERRVRRRQVGMVRRLELARGLRDLRELRNHDLVELRDRGVGGDLRRATGEVDERA